MAGKVSKERKLAALQALRSVMAEHRIGFGYTNDDDGVHLIFEDGTDANIGWSGFDIKDHPDFGNVDVFIAELSKP